MLTHSIVLTLSIVFTIFIVLTLPCRLFSCAGLAFLYGNSIRRAAVCCFLTIRALRATSRRVNHVSFFVFVPVEHFGTYIDAVAA